MGVAGGIGGVPAVRCWRGGGDQCGREEEKTEDGGQWSAHVERTGTSKAAVLSSTGKERYMYAVGVAERQLVGPARDNREGGGGRGRTAVNVLKVVPV